MALAEEPWIPTDTFAARLALVRQHLGGWNVARTARLCGIDEQTWRNWEQGARPRDYEAMCHQIAQACGVKMEWLALGGPLSTKWYGTHPLEVAA